ncbi:hypothetical protein C8Q77DRAFT_1156565 [Trametes polyzona]|nr:hypothetical protein C8Q77DRAFT_1156565 [Trametes polyzona]
MQSPLMHSPTHGFRHQSASIDASRRLSSAGNYGSSAFGGYPDSRGVNHASSGHTLLPRAGANHSFAPSVTVQSPFNLQLDSYTGNSRLSIPDSPDSRFHHHGWQSTTPSPPLPSTTPGVHGAYVGASATSRGPTDPRNGAYTPHPGYSPYEQTRALLPPAYPPSPALSDHYGSSFAGSPAPSFATTDSSYPYGYAATPVPHHHHHHHASPRDTTTRCEWSDCRHNIEDSTPAGIARHLRQYHNIQVTDNRSRHACQWGERPCGKDMYPSSFGKHIAECHLRNMVKQCPHCGADFARADTLSRHIKAFCPNSNGQ